MTQAHTAINKDFKGLAVRLRPYAGQEAPCGGKTLPGAPVGGAINAGEER